MIRALFLAAVFASVPARAQENQDPFAEAFEDMFQIQDPDWELITSDAPPDPPVPLDGGLTALLAAGAAVGYRRFRTKRLASKSNI
ncbi:MAG: PID-CTERM protein-sorting domain-containing protein [Bacteroidota bacterium]